MPCQVQCDDFVLTDKEVATLWELTRGETVFSDDIVSVQCVSAEEMKRLNFEYRKKDSPTNVLTFSYNEDHEHDVSLCMDVAEKEAQERGDTIRDYVALLLVHAFLHVCGMDHERSLGEAKKTEDIEKKILSTAGFVPQALSDVY
jgi:probable rRNA maturation factor